MQIWPGDHRAGLSEETGYSLPSSGLGEEAVGQSVKWGESQTLRTQKESWQSGFDSLTTGWALWFLEQPRSGQPYDERPHRGGEEDGQHGHRQHVHAVLLHCVVLTGHGHVQGRGANRRLQDEGRIALVRFFTWRTREAVAHMEPSRQTYLHSGFGHPCQSDEHFLSHAEAGAQDTDVGDQDPNSQGDEQSAYSHTCKGKKNKDSGATLHQTTGGGAGLSVQQKTFGTVYLWAKNKVQSVFQSKV